MISCKNSTNIDTVIDWLVKHSKSKTWASVPVLFTVAVMILSCSFLFYFLKLSAMSNWVIDVWPLSLFSPCGRVIACIIWVHIQVLLTRQHVVWLFGCILVWFLYVNINQLVWFPNANLLLIVVLNGIMDFAYVVSFVFLWGAGTCLELMVVYSLWNSLCACIAHLLASPIFGCGLNSKHPWPHASWRTRKKVWL
jgi:hypothetical protein